MNFEVLCQKIFDLCAKSAGNGFVSSGIEQEIFSLSRKDFLPLLLDIGAIPECIAHDSSEEKLFTKAAEIVLAKSFQELGLKAETVKRRSGCADVIAKSIFHGYTLVADAKAFRLSRTAKNQKDFKVEALDTWRNDNNYAVLVSPYFQYPKQNSQIFQQAITRNVLLFSWEHLHFLLDHRITENLNTNLSCIWGHSKVIAHGVLADRQQESYLCRQDENIAGLVGLQYSEFLEALEQQKNAIVGRSHGEIAYWRERLKEIESYTRKRAINELVAALKIHDKIKAIEAYSDSLVKGSNGAE